MFANQTIVAAVTRLKCESSRIRQQLTSPTVLVFVIRLPERTPSPPKGLFTKALLLNLRRIGGFMPRVTSMVLAARCVVLSSKGGLLS